MAGHTNRAFRRLCRERGGCGLVTTELMSSQALENRGSRARSLRYYDWEASESPLAVQLYGHCPQVMAEAAKIVVDLGAPIVDINMGCWVPKIAKKGGGAALLSDPRQAGRVVEAVVAAVDVPVTVKIRSGVHPDHITAVQFAKIAQEAGVSAIAVHGRTAAQGFSGQADWEIIAQVCQAVRVPVIANGDVFSRADLSQIVAQTGCAGVMVGRATLGAPWILGHWLGLCGWPNQAERIECARRHVELTQECSQLLESSAARELRGQLCHYQLDQPGQKTWKDQLIRLESFSQAYEILDSALRSAM